MLPVLDYLYFDIEENQWPIVYHDDYNISFMGLEKLHVFDAKKWRNIITYLKEEKFLDEDSITTPRSASKQDLLVVHSNKYLNSLKWSINLAKITEIPPIAFVPNFLVQNGYLKPMRLQTGGSILAGKLALDRGWAINVGGGFHHCSAKRGGGFCPYADITLLIRFLMNAGHISTAMVIDLDAHQGNGYQRDFLECREVYIMDMYNRNIYPRDKVAKQAINRKIELNCLTQDTEYLSKLRKHFALALTEFKPDIVVYNAGTDILENDPLGLLSITEEGIITRDEYVFRTCKEKNIPIVMLTSGGYLKRTARIIADSILNLLSKQIITQPPQTLLTSGSGDTSTASQLST